MYFAPRLLGTATADASGSFTATVSLPADLAARRHRLVAAGVDASGNPYYLVQQVSVAGGAPGLALTGFEPLPWPAGSGALLLAGTALLLLGRRRTA